MTDISDDDAGDDPPKKKGTKLGEQLKAQGRESSNAGAAIKKAMEDMDRQLKPFRDIEDRMKTLSSVAGEGTALGRVSKQIAEQQRAIDAVKPVSSEGLIGPSLKESGAMWELPHIPENRIPRNPIHETNERLERIEERFERMQGIATDAAQIATGLQAAAAEFLQKFERAAADNSRAAGRAIWIGVVAVIIAVAMPTAQILYLEYNREPSNGLEIQAAFESVQDQLTVIREAQAVVTAQFGEAIASSDIETAAILRDIRDLLSEDVAQVDPPADAPSQ